MNRRDVLMLGAGTVGWTAQPAPDTPAWAAPEFDVPRPELVLELVVTCSKPEAVGPETNSKDGQRRSIWPIIGGTFSGRDIKGLVVAGGGDFPVIRPDGVTIIDALYRLRTDDGITVITQQGLSLGPAQPAAGRDTGSCPRSPRRPPGNHDLLALGDTIEQLPEPGLGLKRSYRRHGWVLRY